MKKIFLLILLVIFQANTSHAQKPINIVSTVGQLSDIIKNVGGEHVIVNGLMGSGVDPHLYKATESDVRKLYKADMIFYNGLFLESKMAEIFKKLSKSKTIVAVGESLDKQHLLESLNYKGHFDPHIWFDVTLWNKIVSTVEEALSAHDPAHKKDYQLNAINYQTKLDQLHTYVHTMSQKVEKEQRVLITAHDAFQYFGRTYDFEVLGLQGISTESEAGAKDVMQLSKLIAQRKIRAVFIESSVPERNIKAVQEAVQALGWNVKIGGELFSDAMGDAGTFEGTYIGMVTHNIDTITNALKE